MDFIESVFDYLEFIDEVVDIVDMIDPSIPRMYLRNIENPIEKYDEDGFLLRFRFSKATVLNVLMQLVPNEDKEDDRGLPIPALLQLLIALRFYATSSFQIVCGDLFELSQPTVCRIVNNISRAIAMHLPNYVKFPATEAEKRSTNIKFHEIGGFPGVLGCIDCTHIPIKGPGGDTGEVCRNRKGWMSLNVQAICGPNMEIYDIVTRWPGSVHDSRIFENSSAKLKFDERRLRGLLLGDAGYMQNHYLYTPVANPTTEPERRYNRSHIVTRSTVERLFGIWKRRFPCLSRKFQNSIPNVQAIIAACAVLHNISRESDPELPEDVLGSDDSPAQEGINADVNEVHNIRGRAIRDAFIARHFN